MTVEHTYPASINNRVLHPYSKRIKAYIVQDENDVGIPKERLRASDPSVYHKMSLRFTHTEFAIFENWVQYNLQCGILPFTFTFKTPNGETQTKDVKFVINDGLAYETDIDESRVIVDFEIVEI